jgi:predicted MFS family arabinose efflux permease
LTALLIAYVSYKFGYRAIFGAAAAMAIPAAVSLLAIDANEIDYAKARGAAHDGENPPKEKIAALLENRILVCFIGATLLFHLANAAMLPELGEMLAKDDRQTTAAFMSACVIVTQFVIAALASWIGKTAAARGRRPLLLLGFGVLPVRGVLYTLTHVKAALIGIQVLDGVANAIFVVVSLLVIADLTRGTGRFNLASGALATAVGIGAALSNTIGGLLIQCVGYTASFLGLAGIAFVAFTVLALSVPETLKDGIRRQV